MPAAILARSVVLEARRGGLPWLAAGSIAAALGLAAFLSQVALTERLALQTAVVAAVLRALVVFLVAAQVAASTLREIHDKGLELALSLPLSRSTYFLGRFAGFAACGAALAAVSALPLLAWAPPAAVALWALSLALEAALVAAAAMFFAMTLAQLVGAMTASLGLYLLGRSIAAIQALTATPLAEPTLAQDLSRLAVNAVAFLLPRLDAATRTEWLLYGLPSGGAYASVLGSLAIFLVLLVAAGLFDFHRKSL